MLTKSHKIDSKSVKPKSTSIIYNYNFFYIPSAVHKVEGWLEELHDKRRLIELVFRGRKAQLEQCLVLALLATDLRELEDTLTDRVNALANSSDHLGDSSASAELLLFELRKLQVEAKVRIFSSTHACIYVLDNDLSTSRVLRSAICCEDGLLKEEVGSRDGC